MALGGKTPPANDAAVELNSWVIGRTTGRPTITILMHRRASRNTASDSKMNIISKGVPIGYMQLDSWWYQKGRQSEVLE